MHKVKVNKIIVSCFLQEKKQKFKGDLPFEFLKNESEVS